MNIDNVLRAQDGAGVDASVINNSLHELRDYDRERALAYLKASNRYMAELQHKHAGRIHAFASTIPGGGDEFLRELERAVRQDGLKGCFINSSHQGAYPDDDEARPFFELVTALDIPVFMHPPSIGFGEERMREYRLASSVGRPFDNCLALSRLIVRGIFEQFPSLKFVCSHVGGGITEIIGRMDYAYELQDEAFFLGPYEPMLIKHKPSHYLQMIYLDSVSYHLPAARAGLDSVGVDRFVFGTDAPPLTSLKPRGLALIDELALGPADRNKVLYANAARLLKI